MSTPSFLRSLPRSLVQSAVNVRHWGGVDLALAGSTLVVFLYSWIYFPISQAHTGDFLAMLSNRKWSMAGWWDGQGIGYGPIFAIYDLILRPYDDLTAMRMMYAVNLPLTIASVIVAIRTLLPAPRSRRAVLIALFVAANFYPLVQLVRQNNIELTELAFLVFGYAALMKGRDWTAGTCFGVAIGAKIIPVVLLALLVWRRRWQALAGAVLTSLVLFGVVGVLKQVGPMDLWNEMVKWGRFPFPNEWNNNQALSGFFYRVLSTTLYTDAFAFTHPRVDHPQLAFLLSKAATVVTGILMVVLFVRRAGWWPGKARGENGPLIEVLEAQQLFLVVFLILDHAHTHYFGLILPVYFIALRGAVEGWARNRTTWLFVFSFVFLGMLLPLRLLDPLAYRFIPGNFIEVHKLWSLPMAGAILAVVGTQQLLQSLQTGARLAEAAPARVRAATPRATASVPPSVASREGPSP